MSEHEMEERKRLLASLLAPVAVLTGMLGLLAAGSLPAGLTGLVLVTVAALTALVAFVLVRIVRHHP